MAILQLMEGALLGAAQCVCSKPSVCESSCITVTLLEEVAGSCSPAETLHHVLQDCY